MSPSAVGSASEPVAQSNTAGSTRYATGSDGGVSYVSDELPAHQRGIGVESNAASVTEQPGYQRAGHVAAGGVVL